MRSEEHLNTLRLRVVSICVAPPEPQRLCLLLLPTNDTSARITAPHGGTLLQYAPVLVTENLGTPPLHQLPLLTHRSDQGLGQLVLLAQYYLLLASPLDFHILPALGSGLQLESNIIFSYIGGATGCNYVDCTAYR